MPIDAYERAQAHARAARAIAARLEGRADIRPERWEAPYRRAQALADEARALAAYLAPAR